MAASCLCYQTKPTWFYCRGSLGLISALSLTSVTVAKGLCWFGLWCSHLLYFSNKSFWSVPPCSTSLLWRNLLDMTTEPACRSFIASSSSPWLNESELSCWSKAVWCHHRALVAYIKLILSFWLHGITSVFFRLFQLKHFGCRKNRMYAKNSLNFWTSLEVLPLIKNIRLTICICEDFLCVLCMYTPIYDKIIITKHSYGFLNMNTAVATWTARGICSCRVNRKHRNLWDMFRGSSCSSVFLAKFSSASRKKWHALPTLKLSGCWLKGTLIV